MVFSGFSPASAATVDFTTDTNWVVPGGVTSVHVVAIGGGGGASESVVQWAPGGAGAIVTADLPVTPGETLEIGVGGGGRTGGASSTGAFSGGGGGGGATLIYQSGLAKIISGGGGGSGGLGNRVAPYWSAAGGSAGQNADGSGQQGDNGGYGGSSVSPGIGGLAGWCCGSDGFSAEPGGGTTLEPGMGGSGGSSGASTGDPNGGTGAGWSGNGGSGATSLPSVVDSGNDPGGSGGGGGGGYGGGGGAYGPGGGGAGGSFGPAGRTFSTAGVTGPGAGASQSRDIDNGTGADGLVTISYGAAIAKPGKVTAKIKYPKSGPSRGKALITWSPAVRATGYQTRVATSKAKLKKTKWSAVHSPRKKAVKRKSGAQYFEVRASNSAGKGAAKRLTIKRR